MRDRARSNDYSEGIGDIVVHGIERCFSTTYDVLNASDVDPAGDQFGLESSEGVLGAHREMGFVSLRSQSGQYLVAALLIGDVCEFDAVQIDERS